MAVTEVTERANLPVSPSHLLEDMITTAASNMSSDLGNRRVAGKTGVAEESSTSRNPLRKESDRRSRSLPTTPEQRRLRESDEKGLLGGERAQCGFSDETFTPPLDERPALVQKIRSASQPSVLSAERHFRRQASVEKMNELDGPGKIPTIRLHRHRGAGVRTASDSEPELLQVVLT